MAVGADLIQPMQLARAICRSLGEYEFTDKSDFGGLIYPVSEDVQSIVSGPMPTHVGLTPFDVGLAHTARWYVRNYDITNRDRMAIHAPESSPVVAA